MNIRNKIEYSDYCSHVSYSAQYQILDRKCNPSDITTIVYKHKFFHRAIFYPGTRVFTFVKDVEDGSDVCVTMMHSIGKTLFV